MTTKTTDLPQPVHNYVRSTIDHRPSAETVRQLRRCYREGGERAERLAESHGSTDPWQLADALGVSVRRDSWPGLGGTTLLGTYADGTVTLYEVQIETRAAACGIPTQAAERAVLAHELAHHEIDQRPLPHQPTDTGWLRGLVPGYRRTSLSARAVEEVACHGFTETLVDLPGAIHPVELTTSESAPNATNRTTDHTRPLTPQQ